MEDSYLQDPNKFDWMSQLHREQEPKVSAKLMDVGVVMQDSDDFQYRISDEENDSSEGTYQEDNDVLKDYEEPNEAEDLNESIYINEPQT